ncbi:hypothetical protein [Clostridium haemolyticum]|uniref:Uncharacterized protein n=1 Tax=Clostridium haemolyticum NCTC 9693 TaxID=1443114 RepID=A0ABR4TEH8_CLOHA|nr:hypothetical protein [Clostridium haemolyticum]KEI16731.1 hypothetical protein Z960_08640 [Clostridium haemolyticum NCTC 9693]
MDKLFEWGIIKSGDVVVIKNRDNSQAIVIDSKYVNFKSEKLTLLKHRYKDDVLKNGDMIGEFLILKVGENVVSFSENVSN